MESKIHRIDMTRICLSNTNNWNEHTKLKQCYIIHFFGLKFEI